jgi:hypothetical protein
LTAGKGAASGGDDGLVGATGNAANTFADVIDGLVWLSGSDSVLQPTMVANAMNNEIQKRFMICPLSLASFPKHSTSQFLHGIRQLDVERRDPAGIVSNEVDTDPIPSIEPFRVVVHALGHQRHAGHESKGGDEVNELVLAMELAALERPTW